LLSTTGKRRSTYCFRHTYATFRLSEGVDVLFLAHQMGTSVKMIQDHYGHITPVKNAARILQGMPGWMTVTRAEGL
jgi:integrase